MPNNKRINAFYFFMIDFRAEQLKNGIKFGSLREVATAAGPLWKEAAEDIRQKYKERAKEQDRGRVRMTCTRIPLPVLEQMEFALKHAEEEENQILIDFVKKRPVNSLPDEDIFVMDVNYYAKVYGNYLIGEMTLLKFSVREGVKDSYHGIIRPDSIPVGYDYDVKWGSKEYALQMPYQLEETDYTIVLGKIMDFLKSGTTYVETLAVPLLFTLPEKVAPVANFLNQVCSKAKENDQLFSVYKLNKLFYYMANKLKTDRFGVEVFKNSHQALNQLRVDKYSSLVACQLHKENDQITKCTVYRVNRWAYNILELCWEQADMKPWNYKSPLRVLRSKRDYNVLIYCCDQAKLKPWNYKPSLPVEISEPPAIGPEKKMGEANFPAKISSMKMMAKFFRECFEKQKRDLEDDDWD